MELKILVIKTRMQLIKRGEDEIEYRNVCDAFTYVSIPSNVFKFVGYSVLISFF